MAEFNFPEWRQGPEPPAADLPPPEYAEADAVREQQLNDQYLAGQRQILNLGENAYYRQQGETAIHAAPPALGAVQQLKDDTLAQAGNDRQREALTKRLDWHHGEAQRGISRHLAGQAGAWRQTVADNQVKTAEEEAAVNHSDPTKADSAARRWQQVQEFQRRKDAGETLNVTEERYLLRNRRAASDLAQAVSHFVEAQRNIDQLPTSSALRQLLGASTAAEAARVLRERPGEIAQALGVEGLPALTLSLVTLSVLGPVGGRPRPYR